MVGEFMKIYPIGSNNQVKNANISVRLVEFTCDEPEHIHEGFEMIYIAGGQGEHIIDNNRFRVKRGSLIIMNKDCRHSFKNVEPMKYYNLLFTPDVISAEFEKNFKLKNVFEAFGFEVNENFVHIRMDSEDELKRTEGLLFDCLNEGIKKDTGYVNMIKIKLIELLTILARGYLKSGNVTEKMDEIFPRSIDYIDEKCSDNLELKAVAKRFGYEERRYSDMLKDYFGFGFKKLVIKRKLSKALSCLWQEDISIGDIVIECGFTNKSYFYKLFEEQFGLKPKFVREYWENFYTGVDLKV